MSQFTAEDKEARRVEYEKFYSQKGIDLTKLKAQYETKVGAKDGYQCICTYCSALNSKDCTRVCCRDGKECAFYTEKTTTINRDKAL